MMIPEPEASADPDFPPKTEFTLYLISIPTIEVIILFATAI